MKLEACRSITRGPYNKVDVGDIFNEINIKIANRLIELGAAKKHEEEPLFKKLFGIGSAKLSIPESKMKETINIKMNDGSIRKSRLCFIDNFGNIALPHQEMINSDVTEEKAITEPVKNDEGVDDSPGSKDLSEIVAVIEAFPGVKTMPKDTEYFTKAGLPRNERIEEVLKRDILMQQRNDAWEIVRKKME